MTAFNHMFRKTNLSTRRAEARRIGSAGAIILLLGMALILMPATGAETSVQVTCWILLGAALLELFVGLTSSRPSVRRIEVLLSCVTLGVVILILLRPNSYPLAAVAALCLAVRGTGATVAAFGPDGAVRLWVLARGFGDLILTSILVVGAPAAAVITIISGVPWPPRGAAVLTNFLAVSTILTGLSLLALSLRNRMQGDA